MSHLIAFPILEYRRELALCLAGHQVCTCYISGDWDLDCRRSALRSVQMHDSSVDRVIFSLWLWTHWPLQLQTSTHSSHLETILDCLATSNTSLSPMKFIALTSTPATRCEFNVLILCNYVLLYGSKPDFTSRQADFAKQPLFVDNRSEANIFFYTGLGHYASLHRSHILEFWPPYFTATDVDKKFTKSRILHQMISWNLHQCFLHTLSSWILDNSAGVCNGIHDVNRSRPYSEFSLLSRHATTLPPCTRISTLQISTRGSLSESGIFIVIFLHISRMTFFH